MRTSGPVCVLYVLKVPWLLGRTRPLHSPGESVLEIRFHGRGGQGTVVAAEILSKAAFRQGHHVQSFPFFGVERRGAPVTAYARIDDRPVRIKTSITSPDVVVVLDPSLLRSTPVTDGLRSGGTVLLNASKAPEGSTVPAGRLAIVDASAIATRHGIGSRTAPIVNTAVLGALCRVVSVVTLDSMVEAIRESVPAKPDENIAAAREGYEALWIPEEVPA